MSNYSAVVTTGIYCRPGCGGRPRADHVKGFEFAAAAEAAGYRACLRCRPYREPQPLGPTGPELVCRAVRLIVDGALNEATEVDLGRRLGVSPRHLRRLFAEHVGVTPDQLARSSRAHFARRLLDDTDLSVTDIAYAAGFGSVRQMNRVFLEVFRASPGELRARRRATDRLVADGGLSLRLPYRPPLDLDHLFGYFALRAIAGVEFVEDGVYRRTVVIDGDPGVLEITAGRGGAEHLVLRAHLPHWEGLIHVVQRARRIFDLDADLDAINDVLRADDIIGPLVHARPGLRVPGTWDPFETGVRAIIGQQVSIAGANTLIGRVVARHGTPVAGLSALGLTHTFPTASTLADADLDGLGLPSQRVRAIRSFAAAVVDGRIRLDGSVGLDELVESIVALRGLGPWTANYLALRIGESDAFPGGDLGVVRALSRAAAAGDLTTVSKAWQPWRAYATLHLWAQA